MPETQCHEIREIKHFVDENNREVVSFTQVFGKNPKTLLKGAITIAVGGMGPNGVPVAQRKFPLEFPFPDGTTIKKAFETFDAVAASAFEEWKKQQEEAARAQKIVAASSVPGLVGPGGKPVFPKS